jgi:hypothetical protein
MTTKYFIDGKPVGMLEGEELEEYIAWQVYMMKESAEDMRERLGLNV